MKNFSSSKTTYVLDTGENAAKRLDLLEKVYGNGSYKFLKNAGLRQGMKIAVLGCGIGNMEIWMAHQIGEEGKITAIDISEEQLEIARIRAKNQGLTNIEFVQSDIYEVDLEPNFDLVCARFLLIHLSNPVAAVEKMISLLKNGGVIALEDITTYTAFMYPINPYFLPTLNLMLKLAENKKLDFNIGQKLFDILSRKNIQNINIYSYQPIFSKGEEKLYISKSIEEVSNNLIEQKIISLSDLETLLSKINNYIMNPTSIVGMPATYQLYGTKSSS